MRRLSVESTPIRTQPPIDISTRAPLELESTLKANSTANIGRERFTKPPELQALIKKAMASESQAAVNPNVLRRSGCRCPDKGDPEPDPNRGPCKSRFCFRKQAKSQISLQGAGSDRLKRGSIVKFEGAKTKKRFAISRQASISNSERDAA